MQEQKERLRSSECHDQLFKLKLEESRERRRKRREEKLQITAEEQFEAERRAEEEERKGMLEYFAQWQEENRKKAEEEAKAAVKEEPVDPSVRLQLNRDINLKCTGLGRMVLILYIWVFQPAGTGRPKESDSRPSSATPALRAYGPYAGGSQEDEQFGALRVLVEVGETTVVEGLPRASACSPGATAPTS